MSKTKITVVEQSNEGMTDSDFPAFVYKGHLTVPELQTIAIEIGGVENGGYAGFALAELDEGCFMVVYANDGMLEQAEANKDPETGLFQYEDRGHLTLNIRHTTISKTPAPAKTIA